MKNLTESSIAETTMKEMNAIIEEIAPARIVQYKKTNEQYHNEET